MSAVRQRTNTRQEWWDDDTPTQVAPIGARPARRGSAAVAPERLRTATGAAPAPRGRQYGHEEADERRGLALPTLPALPDPSRLLTTAALIGALALLLYLGITSLLDWTRVKMDDMQYGRPRTSQLDAYVGHNEGAGAPSHFLALNLNRRVTIVEFPGGDVSKPQVIVGPYLFGQSEDLTVVKLRVEEVSGDDKPDLIVQVKDERLIYINENGAFRPVTTEELARVKEREGGR